MTLTDQEEQAYMDDGGNHCPKCKSDDMESGSIQTDGMEAWRDVTCKNPKCGFRWTDDYKMAGISENT